MDHVSERSSKSPQYVHVAELADVQGRGCLVVQVKEHTLSLFYYGDHIYAVDNRCPHMGFPLNHGAVKEGILTCHWLGRKLMNSRRTRKSCHRLKLTPVADFLRRMRSQRFVRQIQRQPDLSRLS
jgi:hypothetical protein